ncbi:hypothetical protein GCM10018782_49620 [Streptomyces griseoaurantiacus]|nr:hypothetical protein GCM10018782_49620 [Streptomyces griseoaurantiacus]
MAPGHEPGSRLMKNTTEDLWPESRPKANGIEPTDAHGESAAGFPHSPSTGARVKVFDAMKWLTVPVVTRLTNPEIGQ